MSIGMSCDGNLFQLPSGNRPVFELSNLVIRRATIEDVPAIINLFHSGALGSSTEIIAEPLPQCYVDAFQAICDDQNSELYVADHRGRVAGTFQLTFINYLMLQGGRVALVESVYVASDVRGQGIGHTMMTWAIERCREQGCHRVQLTTNKQREAAHRFYKRLGFVATHEGMKLFLQETP